MYDIDAFQMKVADWANERNIFTKSNPMKQLEKTQEEVDELKAHTKTIRDVTKWKKDERSQEITLGVLKDLIKDDIGDVVVTLSIQASMFGLTLSECLEYAYREIKDRGGKMIDGLYVKEDK